MKVQYTLQDVAFEWDSQKATANFRKHKVNFELAAEAFFDPFVCYLDEQIVGSELRERLVGHTKQKGNGPGRHAILPCTLLFKIHAKVGNNIVTIQRILMALLLAAILASCAPVTTSTPSETPQPTITLTSIPTATETVTPTITPQPTPMGGGMLKVAFYAAFPDGRYLIVGDYFSGNIDYKIPIRNHAPAFDVSWSPDGAYVLFVDPPALGTEDLKVKLLDMKTGRVSLLNTFPRVSSGGAQWNKLRTIEWSDDSKHVLYSPRADTDPYAPDYIALMDGKSQPTDGYYDTWLPGTKILINLMGQTYNIETSQRDTFLAEGLTKFYIAEFTKDFMLLSPLYSDRDTGIPDPQDKVEAIPYPRDFEDASAWQYDTLLGNKVELVTFSPEITNVGIHNLMDVKELSQNQLSVSGWGNFTVGEKAYDAFRVIVDKDDLPKVVEEKDLYAGEYSAAYSPDGQLALTVALTPDEKGNLWGYNTKWILKDASGKEIRVDLKLSQFEGIQEIYAGVGDSATHSFLSGIDFYWQP